MTIIKALDVVIERDSEGYYIASVPELPGFHTQAKCLDMLMKRIREAIEPCSSVQGQKVSPCVSTVPEHLSIRVIRAAVLSAHAVLSAESVSGE